jgi:hypothetical protein
MFAADFWFLRGCGPSIGKIVREGMIAAAADRQDRFRLQGAVKPEN